MYCPTDKHVVNMLLLVNALAGCYLNNMLAGQEMTTVLG